MRHGNSAPASSGAARRANVFVAAGHGELQAPRSHWRNSLQHNKTVSFDPASAGDNPRRSSLDRRCSAGQHANLLQPLVGPYHGATGATVAHSSSAASGMPSGATSAPARLGCAAKRAGARHQHWDDPQRQAKQKRGDKLERQCAGDAEGRQQAPAKQQQQSQLQLPERQPQRRQQRCQPQKGLSGGACADQAAAEWQAAERQQQASLECADAADGRALAAHKRAARSLQERARSWLGGGGANSGHAARDNSQKEQKNAFREHGARKELEKGAAAHPLDSAGLISKLFFGNWLKELESCNWRQRTDGELGAGAHSSGSRARPSLCRAVIRTHAKWILANSLLTFFAEVVCKSLSAYSVGQMLFHITNRELTDISQPTSLWSAQLGGLGALMPSDPLVFWTATLILVSFCWVLSAHFYGFQMMRVGLHVRVGCSYLIYRKSLKLCQQQESSQTTMGKMTNLLSNDLDKFNYVCLMIPFIWIGPIQTIVSIVLLWPMLGPACFGSLLILFILTPMQFYLSGQFASYRRRIAACTDERLRGLSETMMSLKLIKLYGWEQSFRQLLLKTRARETSLIYRVGIIKGLNAALMCISSKLVLFVTIVFHCLIFGQMFDAKTLFMSMAMLNNVQFTMTQLIPRLVSLGGESLVSLRRICDFLLAEEFKPSAGLMVESADQKDQASRLANANGRTVMANHQKQAEPSQIKEFWQMFENNKPSADASAPAAAQPAYIHCDKMRAEWPHATNTALDSISFDCKAPSLIAVCGQVASGKSSLFMALLGELSIDQGGARVVGSIGFSSQKAWIFAGTIRENILFGNSYDENRYRNVIEVCALRRDFDLLEGADHTYINEEALSGGQRARINLARCLYRDCDIYLLDDPFSAIDSPVAEHIFKQAILGFLSKKLILLATHQIRLLTNCDKILLLNQGHQLAYCNYAELSQKLSAPVGEYFTQKQLDGLSFLTAAFQMSSGNEKTDKKIEFPSAHKANNTANYSADESKLIAANTTVVEHAEACCDRFLTSSAVVEINSNTTNEKTKHIQTPTLAATDAMRCEQSSNLLDVENRLCVPHNLANNFLKSRLPLDDQQKQPDATLRVSGSDYNLGNSLSSTRLATDVSLKQQTVDSCYRSTAKKTDAGDGVSTQSAQRRASSGGFLKEEEVSSDEKLPGLDVWIEYYTQSSNLRLIILISAFLITQALYSTIDIYLTVWSIAEQNKALLTEIENANQIIQQNAKYGAYIGDSNNFGCIERNYTIAQSLQLDSNKFSYDSIEKSINTSIDDAVRIVPPHLPQSAFNGYLVPILHMVMPRSSERNTGDSKQVDLASVQTSLGQVNYTPLPRKEFAHLYNLAYHSNQTDDGTVTKMNTTGPETLTTIFGDAFDRDIYDESESALNVRTIYRPLYVLTKNLVILDHATIYALLLMALFFSSALTNILSYSTSSNSAKKLYEKLVDSALFAKLSFFDSNPIGRFINRATRDMGIIDEAIPYNANQSYDALLQTAATFIVVSAVDFRLAPLSLIILFIFLIYHSIHVRPTKDIQRIEGNSRSPIISHVATTLEGLHTIRVTKSEQRFEQYFMRLQDAHTSVFLFKLGCNRCMAVMLDWINASYIGLIAITAVTSGMSGPSAGLIITSAMLLSGLTQHGAMKLTETESLMTSVERIIEYCKLPQEECATKRGNRRPSSVITNGRKAIWPSDGRLVFRNVDLYYSRKSHKPVLRNISFSVQAGEKVGIIGRTGAGKSSIVTALFRLYDYDGTILLDDVDIKTLNLIELRSSMGIIPQHPVLFSTSVRQNLDPMNLYDDFALWSALDKANLRATINSLPGQLSYDIGQGGLSAGQKQLICLARVLLRQNKLILMDEATANVDPTTDALIQTTIRREFKHCTVITIAHRLKTIHDCDRIMLLDEGRIIEFDTPENLAAKSNSCFAELVRKSTS